MRVDPPGGHVGGEEHWLRSQEKHLERWGSRRVCWGEREACPRDVAARSSAVVSVRRLKVRPDFCRGVLGTEE